MPLLRKEPDIFPEDLLDGELSSDNRRWWALYTLSRREKQLMRLLRGSKTPHYGPLVPRRYRSPAGRIRVCHQPLFSNYVFLYGNDDDRGDALATNCVSRSITVDDGMKLATDLRRVQRLIMLGQPMTPEARLAEGTQVRVRNGAFAGFEGTVLRRANEVRLLVAVRFMNQGVSVALDDCQLEQVA